jgi:hypothetical protein
MTISVFTSQTIAKTGFPHHNSSLDIRSLVVMFKEIFSILAPLTKLLAPQTALLGVISFEWNECFRIPLQGRQVHEMFWP